MHTIIIIRMTPFPVRNWLGIPWVISLDYIVNIENPKEIICIAAIIATIAATSIPRALILRNFITYTAVDPP
jgi:hypothetical protein